MASSMYAKVFEKFLDGEISWSNDDIKCVLLNLNEYTLDAEDDEFLSDIPEEARIAVSSNLSGKSSTGGVADASDIYFDGVSAGIPYGALALFVDSGNPNSSHLIAYIDTATLGLPGTTTGSRINVVWDNGTNKIFRFSPAT